MLFSLDPAEVGLPQEQYQLPVWGIVMETGLSDGFFTLSVLAEGTTSLYFSSGGGILGGGQHANVRVASGLLLKQAQLTYRQGEIVEEPNPPTQAMVNFYFLTYSGIYGLGGQEDHFKVNSGDLSELFTLAHGVIRELREVEENK